MPAAGRLEIKMPQPARLRVTRSVGVRAVSQAREALNSAAGRVTRRRHGSWLDTFSFSIEDTPSKG